MKRVSKKFDRKLNQDTATADKISKTNQELYKYLVNKGELVAAKQVDFLIKNSGAEQEVAGKPNPVYDKLLKTNEDILSVIRKMQADMIDEQDTSIKKVQKTPSGDTIINNYYEVADEEKGGLDINLGRLGKGRLGAKSKGGKNTSKAPKVPTGEPSKPTTPAPTTPDGKPTSTPDEPKKTGKTGKAGKGAEKAAKGGKIIKTLTKFLKPIPVLGTAIAAATAVYAAVDGWENASAITGIPEENLTTAHKTAAAVGAIVDDFTFGIVSASSTAKTALRFAQPNDIKETEKKYVQEGIIEDPMFGPNQVLDWKALEKLPAYEIEKIISIDDWSDADKERLWKANKRAAEREAIKTNELISNEEGVSKVPSDTTVTKPTTGAGTGSTGGARTSSGTSGGSSGGTSATSAPASQTSSATGKFAGVSGSPIPNAEQSKAPIISVEDFGPGWNVVKRSDGTVEKRIGNRNWRNNNPGNIEFGPFSQKFKALTGDPRFAIFPTYDNGREAKRELIFYGKNYTNLSLSQAIARYAPPSENNTNSYIANVLGAVGGVEKYMREYNNSEQDSILNAMQRIEGWAVGRVELIEKGTGTTDAQKATPTPNSPSGPSPSSPGGGGVTTPMTIEKGGNLSGPTSAKSVGSGVNTSAPTTTANVATGGNTTAAASSKPTVTTAEVSKAQRENTIQQSNANLVAGTKQYDNSVAATTGSKSTAITNINSSKAPKQDYGQDRILNLFS
jgi:hypothetical protein